MYVQRFRTDGKKAVDEWVPDVDRRRIIAAPGEEEETGEEDDGPDQSCRTLTLVSAT